MTVPSAVVFSESTVAPQRRYAQVVIKRTGPEHVMVPNRWTKIVSQKIRNDRITTHTQVTFSVYIGKGQYVNVGTCTRDHRLCQARQRQIGAIVLCIPKLVVTFIRSLS